MNHKTPWIIQILVTATFVILLGIPIALELEAETPKGRKNNEEAKATALDLFGFYLDEVNDKVGINFAHQSPKLDPKLDHILPQIASVGASVSICDFNNDGWNDIYLTTSSSGESNALYENQGDGTFRDVANKLNVGNINQTGTGVSMGSVWADVNNDGFEDLFVYKWGKPELFLNRNGQMFEPIGDRAGLPTWTNSNSAIWFDYNNDGNIDLLIGGYYDEEIDLWNLKNTLIMPESFEYANNGGRNYLLENQGDELFRDVSTEKGLKSTKWTLAIGALDFDGNGFQDLFIANDYSVDELYLNIKGNEFREIGRQSNIGYAPKSGMNVSVGDIKNDGNFSIYVSNITEMGILLQGNNLWQPSQTKGNIEFENNAGIAGIELGGWSYGAQFGDLNNDGFQDLYLANGFISATKNNSYWYDYSKITGGNRSIISDAKNWPPMEGRSQSGYQHNKIWMNGTQGTFADVTEYVSGIPPFDSRAVAMVDLWNRGVLDVVVANQNSRISVLKNHLKEGKNWIAFSLEGIASNRSAIGAKVTLKWNNQIQSQIVTGGIGFSAQNQRALHFGIGETPKIDSITIHWPSGMVQELKDLEVNKLHQIKEGNEVS